MTHLYLTRLVEREGVYVAGAILAIYHLSATHHALLYTPLHAASAVTLMLCLIICTARAQFQKTFKCSALGGHLDNGLHNNAWH